MNRHSYGGYDAPPPRRRSASPPHRGSGGFRGGRGGARPPRGRGGGYGGGSSYDSGYDAYGSAPSQDSYGTGSGYGSGPMSSGGPDYPSPYGGAPPPRDSYYGGPPSSSGPSNDYSDYPSYNGSDYGGSSSRGYESSGRGGYDSGGRGGYEGGGRGRGGPARGRGGRIHDDRVHNSIIEERLMRERPCRTLFIRNIKYETPSEHMRTAFEAHGEIKTFFDLIKNRGMVFVTFYDLRAAERAREKLQGMDVSGRPIDVHYSLPREHELTQRPDREKNQGTLLVTLRESLSRQAIDDGELRRKMQQFGEVKSIKSVFDGGVPRHDQRLVEYFDSRACVHAHDRLRDQTLQDGLMDLEFEWDVPEEPVPISATGSALAPAASARSPTRYNADRGPAPYRGAPSGDRDWDGPPRGRGGGPAYRDDFDRGGRDYTPPDRRGGPDYRDRRESTDFPPLTPIGGGPPHRGDYDRGRDDRDRDFDRGAGGRGGGRGGYRGTGRDEWRGGGRGGRGGGPGAPGRPPPPRAPGTDEFGRALPSGREADPSDAYAPPGGSYQPYAGPPRPGPPAASGGSAEDRLEQAKKVQELLAALKPTTSAALAPAPGPAATSYGYPPISGGGLPPMPSSGGYAPTSSTGGYPPYSAGLPSSAYQPSTGYQPTSTLPGGGDMQNLLALLAQNQQQQGPPPR